jgi:HAD superfamily hydrolase (TIGR01509 family)
MLAMTDFRGVLFDVDGTLVDSSYIHTVCWWQAFRQAELDAPMAVIHRAVGMGGDRLVPHVLAHAQGDTGHRDAEQLTSELTASHDAIYSTYWSALRTLPGAREVLRRCHESDLLAVLASSAGERELAVLRGVLDCDQWIDAATSAADADTSKPDPDLVIAALDKAGLAPHQALFVGDAVWDVEAAGRAGVRCVGLECGGTSAAELRAAGAWRTYQDPADLLRDWTEIGATR